MPSLSTPLPPTHAPIPQLTVAIRTDGINIGYSIEPDMLLILVLVEALVFVFVARVVGDVVVVVLVMVMVVILALVLCGFVVVVVWLSRSALLVVLWCGQ